MLVLPDHELGAISIMLDLVNPLVAFWWRFDQVGVWKSMNFSRSATAGLERMERLELSTILANLDMLAPSSRACLDEANLVPHRHRRSHRAL